jgi:hypothetical protein
VCYGVADLHVSEVSRICGLCALSDHYIQILKFCFHLHALTSWWLSRNWLLGCGHLTPTSYFSDCCLQDWTHQTNILSITSWCGLHRKHHSSLLYPLVSIQTCLFAKPLLSNSRHIFAFLRSLPSSGSVVENSYGKEMFLFCRYSVIKDFQLK